MHCEVIALKDGTAAFVCGGRHTHKRCACGQPATKLCDFPTARGKTCDRPLCDRCAVGIDRDVDYCPDHPRTVARQLALEGL